VTHDPHVTRRVAEIVDLQAINKAVPLDSAIDGGRVRKGAALP
jgi:hypothetical protein